MFVFDGHIRSDQKQLHAKVSDHESSGKMEMIERLL